MPDLNPYAPPQSDQQIAPAPRARRIRSDTNSAWHLVWFLPVSTMAGGIFGGQFAQLLDRLLPQYYPNVFAGSNMPAGLVGLMAGVEQGSACGFLSALVLGIGLAWSKLCYLSELLRGMVVVLFTAILGSIVGMMLGIFAAEMFPRHYGNIAPHQVAMGLGCANGLMFGAVLGTFLAILWIRQLRAWGRV